MSNDFQVSNAFLLTLYLAKLHNKSFQFPLDNIFFHVVPSPFHHVIYEKPLRNESSTQTLDIKKFLLLRLPKTHFPSTNNKKPTTVKFTIK